MSFQITIGCNIRKSPYFDTRIGYLFSMTDRLNQRPNTRQRFRFEEPHTALRGHLTQPQSFYGAEIDKLNHMMRDSGATLVQVPRQQQ